MPGMTKLDTSKTEWDLSPLLAGDDDSKINDYRDAISKVTEAFESKWRDRDDYLTDPKVLKEALDDYEAWERFPKLGDENFYFDLRLAQDSNNPKLQAGENKATEFLQGIINRIRFFGLSVSKITLELQPTFLEYKPLAPYRHWLELQFQASSHQLSEAEEKIMMLKSTAAHEKWVQMTERFLSQGERDIIDEDGKTVTATMETMLTKISSRNKKVRDEAVRQFNDFLTDYLQTGEAEMNAILGNKKVNDELRHYDRPDASRHLSDDVESEVVDTLLDAVTDRFDISRRFYVLKAKLLGQKDLGYHERSVPYGSLDKKYTYNEAATMVHEVFESVDGELADIYKSIIEHGQVDAFPHKGKRGGAFCTVSGSNQPVYVMLNFTNELKDVSTIAHEFGHAVNHQLIKKQHALNHGVSLASAEVASNFMQGFILDRLKADADDDLKLALMVDELDGVMSGITRQVAMYRFEQELHAEFRRQGYLSHTEIGRLFQKHMAAYMGEAVRMDPGSENWWLYVGHFRVFFYVYAYASGDLIAQSLRAKVKADPKYIDVIKDKFLSVGLSKSFKEMFADMGIDVTDKGFWQQGLDEIDQLLQDTEALAKKLGKI
jgi:oligoendopeptidase F